jgi:MoaA/NifB/PqqE/SkfB family radical SAM enzyme
MMNYTLKLFLRLISNGIRFQYLKRTGKPGKPQSVSLEITHECIARCIMCNIWKIPGDVSNLSMPEWIKLLSSELFADIRELDVTGGEPFIRDDLIDLFDGICELKHKNLKRLKSIIVTTNGFLTERVLTTTVEILQALQKRDLYLVVVCSLDAVGKLHNRIRNYKNGWSKVSKTIEGLVPLRDRYPNLIVGLKSTILPLNINELSKIQAYADSKGLFTIISPCIITEGRYLNPDRAEELSFTPENIEKMIDFFSGNQFRWSFHAESLVEFFKTGTIKKPCTCGFNYFFVHSNGEMFLCPLIQESVGNITEKDISDLFFSNKANVIRRQIGRLPQCQVCTEPGLERYSLPYEGFQYLKLFFKMGSDEFFQLHYYLGLDKYI